MRYGDKEKWFANLEAEGELTDSLPQAPDMEGIQWLWDAWNDLNSCRSVGMALGPIPWTAADQYARRHELSGHEFELLWYCIGHLERIYTEHQEQERKRREAKHSGKKRNARR